MKYDHICPESQFLRDVSMHQMQIIRDDGASRHIRFKTPATMCMHFDLITWPGYLCYTGDMGTYVFRRLEDMFEFFRTDRRNDKPLAINPGYWGEKLESVDRCDSLMKYSAEIFRQRVKEAFDEVADDEPDEAKRAKCWAEIEDRVLYYADEGEHEARTALLDFCSDDGFEFIDTFEWNFRDYTFRFIWCCYALSWGIQKYDEAKI
jgi:hypothetical protein